MDVEMWWQHELVLELLMQTTTHQRTSEVSLVFLPVGCRVVSTVSGVCKYCIDLNNSVVCRQLYFVSVDDPQFVELVESTNLVENHFIEFLELLLLIVHRAGR